MVRGAGREELRRAEAGEYLTIDSAFCEVKHAFRVLNTSNSNKTAALAKHAIALLDEGVDPAEIRVICVSPEACLAFWRSLKASCGSRNTIEVERIQVITTRALSLDILSTPEAQTLIGRSFCNNRARLLSDFELDFVLEDLKTLGIRPRRLREILKFLFRGLTELADEGTGWLVTIEEQEILAFLKSELRFLQGVIEPELSNLASKALRASATLKDRFARLHLFADDYQDLNRASQLLCHVLATDSICVAAQPGCPVETFDSFPYAKGVEEFIRINPAAQAIPFDEPQSAPHITTLSWKTPQDEFSGIAELVREKLDAGVSFEQIAVVCFHSHWFKQVASELEEYGIPSYGFYRPLTLKGDIRDLDRSLPLRIVTALHLLADPTDSLSWRCWLGFGDYLANSTAFNKARRAAEAIDPKAVFSDSVQEWDGWRETRDYLDRCRGKAGHELLEYLCKTLTDSDAAQLPAVLSPLLRLGDKATPSEMVALLEQKQFFPLFTSDVGSASHSIQQGPWESLLQPWFSLDARRTGQITVTSLEMLASLSFDHVILAGFVDGFFPPRRYFDLTETTINQQKHMEESDRHRLNLLLSATIGTCTLSHFRSIDQEMAELLKLKSDRIVLVEGRRTSQVSLSTHAKALIRH